MHELELEPVGVVEEHGVVPGLVPVGLRAALDLGVVRAQPLGPLVDGRPRGDLERDVVQADAVAVVRRPRSGVVASRRPSELPGPVR